MTGWLADFKYAFRRLTRAPGFAAIAIVTVALGIGANTAIFSLVQAVILQPLPYGDPARLVMLWGKVERGATTDLSGPEVRDYMTENRTFASVAAYTGIAVNLTGGQDPERVVAAQVTPNVFATLDVPALVGRGFAPTDRAPDIADQIVLGYRLWQRRFGGDRAIVGQRILVNGAPTLVVGVMPDGFKLPLDYGDDQPSELWRPLNLAAQFPSWGDHSLTGVARLGDRVTREQATSAMRALEDRWIEDNVGGGWNNKDIKRRAAVPLEDLVVGDVRPALWMLLGAVGVILLIACANVANLTLARSDERSREIAIRTAIGASRDRIVRQLLSESVMLSVLGGALGLALAYAAMRVLVVVHPPGIPRLDQIGLAFLNRGVLSFTLLLTAASGVLFGLAPALELSRPDLNQPLKDGGWSGTSRQRFRDVLAVAQMALSVVLLVGALLIVRSFVELRRIDLGFDPRSALTMRVVLTGPEYAKDPDAIRAIRTIQARLSELPGVRSVGATRLLPLTGTIGNWSITLEGRTKQPGENPNGDWQVVTPGYLETMGIRLVRGRFFASTDDENAPVVAVISESMAAKYWPNEDAIGKRFRINSDIYPWVTIVGIAGRVRHNTVIEQPRTEMYVPHAQWGAAGGGTRRGLTFVVRTIDDPLSVLARARAAVRSVDPNLPLAEVRTLEQVTGGALAQARFTTWLLGLFAGLALTLATIGIYGVMSLLVARRRREIGIRMALGARRASIVGMVVGRGMALALAGVVFGLAAAAGLTRLVANLLYGVTPLDPVTFASVPALLASVALLACVVPAGRAARVNPISALREE